MWYPWNHGSEPPNREISVGAMKATADTELADILSRDIPSAIADAIVEHESWLAAWQRAALCGLPPGDDITGEDSHAACRFGRWYAHHSAAGMLEGRLFSDLGRMHHDAHDAARRLMAKRLAGKRIPAEEYDAMMDVAHKFRKIAVRIQELHGRPEEGAVIADDDLAELQSRLNMLSELEREWERAARTGSPMSLIMVRPDGLDAVRRSYGQVGIDRVVASLAARLFSHLRPYDSVFRYGRVEFLICVPAADGGQAEAVAARLDSLLGDDPVSVADEKQATVTARFGISVSDTKSPVQEIFDRASRAANMAGSGPGERIVVWSAELEN
jgi:diguanylate cyclase (GGDEF)-like protein